MRLKLAVALSLLAAPLHAQSLSLHFFDVGQGDATLIREGGKAVLFDAGPNNRIVEFLRAQNVDTLDLVIASHPHADHIYGMVAVLQTTVVRNYLDNGISHNTNVYRRTMAEVERSQTRYLSATSRTFTLGSATVRILAPPATATSHNNASVGALIEFGAFRALLTGDSETKELAHWLENDSIPQVHVVKVAHHGAANGTTVGWAVNTRPAVAVISLGPNSYGHPSQRTLTTWTNVGARIYRTDVHGTIVIQAKPDGTFTVSTSSEP